MCSNKYFFPLHVAREALVSYANALVATYGFRLDTHKIPRLNLTDQRLELWVDGFKPLFIDFNDTKWARRGQAAGKQQGLIKACQPQAGLRIIDATAGWGRDAIILAHFGAEVLMLERHPLMAALLEDALKRFCSSRKIGPLSLWYGNAIDYLQDLDQADYPDVIYVDPMHPLRQKSALVKKDMQILQNLIGPDLDAFALIQVAQQRVRQRVVVKWPQRAPSLINPSYSIMGKTVRFDVYLPIKLKIN